MLHFASAVWMKKTITILGVLLGLAAAALPLWARSIYVNRSYNRPAPYYGAGVNPYYNADPYYGNNVVIIERSPVLVPRYGSNDELYTYDNIYGPGASAAGRMSHTVHNPQPYFFYAY